VKLRPEGCLPTVTVRASLGGSALRSMTYNVAVAPSGKIALTAELAP
jgi:hypothetical protein